MSATTGRHENAVARCLEAWNAREPEALAEAVAAAWAVDGGCTGPPPEGGPPADVRGHERIAAVVAAAHARFPGFVFRLTGRVDGHHDTARFSWEPVDGTGGGPAGEGAAPVAGSDAVTLDAQDRITAVLGFLDRVPAGT